MTSTEVQIYSDDLEFGDIYSHEDKEGGSFSKRYGRECWMKCTKEEALKSPYDLNKDVERIVENNMRWYAVRVNEDGSYSEYGRIAHTTNSSVYLVGKSLTTIEENYCIA